MQSRIRDTQLHLIPPTAMAAVLACACASGTGTEGDAATETLPDMADADTGGEILPDTLHDTPLDTSWDPDAEDDTVGDADADVEDDVADTTGDPDFDPPVDPPFDTGTDTVLDTAVDSATDTGTDTGWDTGVDTAIDPWVDTSPDTVVDTAHEDIVAEIPPTCGDGTLDMGEECDDGSSNALAPDACRPDCTLPSCGDGIVDSTESCDSGAWPLLTPGAEGSFCRSTHDCDASAPICSGLALCQDGSLGDACVTDADCDAAATAGCIEGQCRDTRCPTVDTPEVCDGIDNDCNGTVDDGCRYECTRDDRPIVDLMGACLADCSPVHDELFVPCGAVYVLSGVRSYSGPVTIEGWVVVSPYTGTSGGLLQLRGTDVVVSGWIECSEAGHPQESGPGGSTNGNGGSHGGLGGISGHGTGDPLGPTYGTLDTAAIDMGSGGGASSGFGGGSGGGSGGGALHLAGDTVDFSGWVICDGGDATLSTDWAAGGGSGGGILIQAGTSLDFSGVVHATGGDGYTGLWGGAGGGGGRIKLLTGGTGTDTGSYDVSGGVGATATIDGEDGDPGTFYRNF